MLYNTSCIFNYSSLHDSVLVQYVHQHERNTRSFKSIGPIWLAHAQISNLFFDKYQTSNFKLQT